MSDDPDKPDVEGDDPVEEALPVDDRAGAIVAADESGGDLGVPEVAEPAGDLAALQAAVASYADAAEAMALDSAETALEILTGGDTEA